ncbi:glycine-rich domain-containing protein [Actinomadura violacea]|uniref:Uncharacterized protein n=1 Tax=Actinomadura violacea TaxID=2819934 RepID=A0ABS3S948_9ACTN|nr:hypothetical protein [Actinomadura violacea]MBO2465539.1 hypothetical protein [Actinomadura violacea]
MSIPVDTTDPSPLGTADPRDLVPADLFGRLAARISRDHAVEAPMAERIMSQALAFLAACARHRGAGLTPSSQVDIGWHTFLLYTAEYTQFCARVAGGFIHHRPDDDELGAMSSPADRADRITATLTAIQAAGMPVDTELWDPARGGDGATRKFDCQAEGACRTEAVIGLHCSRTL